MGVYLDKNEEDPRFILPVKIPRVVPFLLIAFSIATAALLMPIEIVRVIPIIMTRTELVRATISSTKTQTITGTTYLTTTRTGIWGLGALTQIAAITTTTTATTTVVMESTLTKSVTVTYTASTTTKEPVVGDGVMDYFVKMVSLASGTAGIVSFVLQQRERHTAVRKKAESSVQSEGGCRSNRSLILTKPSTSFRMRDPGSLDHSQHLWIE